MGPVPQAGGWHRLEIPASALGLAGSAVTDLSFGAYDGQVWFDRVSRMPEPARITSFTLDRDYGEVTADWSATGASTLEYKLVVREIDTLETTVIVDWSTTTTSAYFEVDYGRWAVELYVRNAYGSTRDLRAFQHQQE
jgi:hypothetical protein